MFKNKILYVFMLFLVSMLIIPYTHSIGIHSSSVYVWSSLESNEVPTSNDSSETTEISDNHNDTR